MKTYSLYLAWLVTLAGLIFSLVLSNIYHWPICHLCWYQRMCLYPLVVILGIACFREDTRISLYTLPLTIIGGLLALYQYLEQMIPGFAPIDVCGSGPSCSDVHMKLLGFITLPFISMVGFVVISILLFFGLRFKPRKSFPYS
jgi:disulfide bond formation protein DsbB